MKRMTSSLLRSDARGPNRPLWWQIQASKMLEKHEQCTPEDLEASASAVELIKPSIAELKTLPAHATTMAVPAEGEEELEEEVTEAPKPKAAPKPKPMMWRQSTKAFDPSKAVSSGCDRRRVRTRNPPTRFTTVAQLQLRRLHKCSHGVTASRRFRHAA